MIRLTASSRLHFGLLHVPDESAPAWPDGLPVRRFGGVGLMVREPAVTVRVDASAEWAAVGPNSDRALAVAQRFADSYGCSSPVRVTVEACPTLHAGLGAGTQLALAIGMAVASEFDGVISHLTLAAAVGRGERSGIGVAGFHSGGLIVDGGRAIGGGVSPRVARVEFPTDWPLVLVRPAAPTTWQGDRERAAFSRHRPPVLALRTTERMCRLALLGLLPAVLERDPAAFGEALYEYNRAAGEPFTTDQGGVYSSPAVAGVVAAVRAAGIPGVGQSSWGPTVFAVCPDADRAAHLATELRSLPGTAEVRVTAAANHGFQYDEKT